ncbi:MAG: hypothetical protein EXX96DRAFT_609915 [Benjaminiella poitrasii]|nr:MAG: hypothetical protein EXX96DRAFT_609915 [Benjaminiella poitrasii]
MSLQLIDPELLLFSMGPKYPPGSDLISKLVLRNPDVVEMITTTLVGPNAASMYSPRPTREWAGGSKSDIVYVSNVSSTSFPPILIEVQHTITPEFIDRLINYSLSVKKCFKAKPTVIVFGTHATLTEISMDFEPTAFEFARGIPSKYWAEKCYILDKSTIAKATKVTPLPAMMALTYFFSSQKLSPLSSEFQDDPTIQKLYSIAKDQTSTRIPAEKSVAEVLLEVCEQTNKQFKKISNTLEPMPDTLLKKRLRAYASDGLLYTETCKRMCIRESDSLVESMPLPPELSELAKSLINESSSSIDILRAEADLPKTDMEYVQQFKESEEKMDWKKCFEGGKKEGFFSSYSSFASLKTAYYKKTQAVTIK